MITKKIRHKDSAGNIIEVDIGADAKNVTEDAGHRFVSDAEKNTWNGKVSTAGGETADTKVGSFAPNTTSFPVPTAGESTRTLWGKVKKFFEDLNNLRASMLFVGSIVNNCVTNNGQLPLSAAQGKVLMDLYTVLNAKATTRKLLVSINTGGCEGACDAYTVGNLLVIYGYVKAFGWPTTDLSLVGIGNVKVQGYTLFGAYGMGGTSIRAEVKNGSNSDGITLIFRIPSNCTDYYFFNASFAIH